MMHHSNLLDGTSGAGTSPMGDSEPHRMRVTVVFTTIEGTITALETALSLATGLAAEIVLVVTEVVYFRWRLDTPPVSRHYFEELCRALVHEATLDADKITFEIHFCRNQIQCLQQILRPRSLVVLGAKSRLWFSQERRLEQHLSKLGHDVQLIDTSSGTAELNANYLVRRLLDQTEQNHMHR